MEFGKVSRTDQNPPCSKPWAIAQAFCSILAEFGPFKIVSKSSRTIPKTLIIAFTSMWETFYGVWEGFQDWPKSAMFKTMGYSPGLLLKIGLFRTLGNCIELFTNNLLKSYNCIYKHVGDVLWSLGRFPWLTKIRHVQNHGLYPRPFAQYRPISDPW